jgi:rubredoxin
MVGEIVKEPLRVPEIAELTRKKKCLTEGCDGYLDKRIGAYGPFYACPVCKHAFRERGGEPVKTKTGGDVMEAPCPLGCGKKARRFEGKYGPFWKCFCSPRVVFRDIDGKPAIPEERPRAKCPVKKCKGMAEQRRKKDGTLFWKCAVCQNFFDDKDGKPAIRENRESRAAKDAPGM